MNELHVEKRGERRNPAILFLHGFLGGADDWKAVIADLSKRFFCVCPDLPGHGESTGLQRRDAYTIAGACAQIDDLLDALELERCALVGYSMGGRIGLNLCLRHPARFNSLVLESASPGIEDAGERETRRRSDESWAMELERGAYESFLEKWYNQAVFASLAGKPEIRGDLVLARLRNDPRELARALRGMGVAVQEPMWSRLKTLQVPLLFVAGAEDGRYVEIGRHVSDLAPKSNLAVVPGAGHIVHRENKREFVESVRSFCSEWSE
jgi:2-succinyl-6-hydroxy-2,4-cyclohexadiene-1-carboxylate synthase